MGLGCAALTSNPRFPTYPDPLSPEQVSAGLSAPATAITLLGKGGAVLMLILLFMAVTSSTSAELIAVSSLLTFDVYKTYLRPKTSSAKLVTVSHYGIVVYTICLAVFCCILNVVGLSLTWLLTVLGIIVGGASVPVGLILLWDRMSTVAAIASPWIGLICGVIVWFITTWNRSGSITVATTGDPTNAVAGNITSWGVGIISAVILTYLFPSKYTSTDPKHIERANKIQGIFVGTSPQPGGSSPVEEPRTNFKEASVSVGAERHENEKPALSNQKSSSQQAASFVPTGNELIDFLESKQMEPMDPVLVKKGERLAWGAGIIFLLVAVILVPFTLFGMAYVFNKAFFTGWVVVSFIWVWTSVMICVVYPVVCFEIYSLWLVIFKSIG
mgnify:CR=1 FL=1